MSKEAKKLYEALKDQGALGAGWTGKWQTDKKKFIEQFHADEEIINGSADLLSLDEVDEWP